MLLLVVLKQELQMIILHHQLKNLKEVKLELNLLILIGLVFVYLEFLVIFLHEYE